jgi:hypothetical protein
LYARSFVVHGDEWSKSPSLIELQTQAAADLRESIFIYAELETNDIVNMLDMMILE